MSLKVFFSLSRIIVVSYIRKIWATFLFAISFSRQKRYKTSRVAQIRSPVKSLFSKVSNAIGIRIRSWEEVRYSNEPANLLPDPPVRARLLNFVLQVKKRRVCYWANPQTHTYTRARVCNEQTQTFSNGRAIWAWKIYFISAELRY